MVNSYYKATDKQAWTDNIASQLQGVTTSVDANGDGIIVEQGTCPSISITLDKPTVTACEAETGSLTVNDPSGQSGTVALTLPDASTQSFTYTGGAPAPIPFSYAVSEPVGSTLSFSATATSNSGASSQQPVTAKANVIAGGLTVTMTPDTATVEPWLQDRSISFMQGGKQVINKKVQSVQARTQDIQITVTGPQGPVLGAKVNAVLEMFLGAETFGGHDHGINGRPLGTLGSLSPVQEVNGKYNTTYTSSIYASKAQIRVTATDPATQCSGETVSKAFVAKVGGLVQFNTALGINRLVGGTCNHHGAADSGTTCTSPNNNHYLTQASLDKLIKLQQAYAMKYPNRGGLRINDASLPYGGKFEVCNDSSPRASSHCINRLWKTHNFGHKTHRRGLDVDIGNRDTYDIPGKPPYTVTAEALRFLNKKAQGGLFAALKDESATANHLHIYFE